MAQDKLLKKDLFGEIRLGSQGAGLVVIRDVTLAAPAARWLARRMMFREARALSVLEGIAGVPTLGRLDRDAMSRSYLPGQPLHQARPADAGYFRATARLLRQLHQRGIAHNDLAKEPNVLVLEDGSPGFIDFQLATHSTRRGRLFRALAMEDIRHLLKHKRSYRPDLLTERELRILSRPGVGARVWRRLVKPVYMFVTRRLLGWADREGAADRGSRN